MTTNTPTTRTLEIDGMTGSGCVQKVTDALKGVRDVSTRGVEVGSATIAADQRGCDSACGAIGKAGYKARESGASGAVQPAYAPNAAGPKAAPASAVTPPRSTEGNAHA